jgi:hypothetical protein
MPQAFLDGCGGPGDGWRDLVMLSLATLLAATLQKSQGAGVTVGALAVLYLLYRTAKLPANIPTAPAAHNAPATERQGGSRQGKQAGIRQSTWQSTWQNSRQNTRQSTHQGHRRFSDQRS